MATSTSAQPAKNTNPSFWDVISSKSTRAVQAEDISQVTDDFTRSLLGTLGIQQPEKDGKEMDDVVTTPKQGDSRSSLFKKSSRANCSSNDTNDINNINNNVESTSTNLFVGVMEALNMTSSVDGNKNEASKEVNTSSTPVTSPASSSSFASKWSLGSSFCSPLESMGGTPVNDDEKKEEDPVQQPFPASPNADNKWRTSSIRESSSDDSTTKSKKKSCRPNDRPSVYEESLEMIIAALLIYTFADLRKMEREGKIPSDKSLTKHPITISQVMEAIDTHREALDAQAKIDQDDLESRLVALKNIHRHQQQSSTSLVGRLLRGGTKKNKEAAVLTHFHDEKSTQGMVYGIAVNHIRKRITVIFRGSVTQQDFITDVKLAQKKVNNPVATIVAPTTETPPTINIHTGFYGYLFKKDDTGRVRIEHILDDVKSLMKKHKGYRMYCTGHSLGGALSSLCGFYAAVDPKITKNGPVVVISVASPRVGNDSFRTAFQTLEKLRLLQHLRISNKEDAVTLLPFVAWKEASLLSTSMLAPTSHSVNLYKHCGIHLKLKSWNDDPENCPDERQLFSVTYAKDKSDDDEGAFLPEELKRSVVAAKSLVGSFFATRADFTRVITFHCCDEYERRLEMRKKYLDSITLDQLYAAEGLVGSIVATPPEPEPKKSTSSFFSKRKSTSSMKASQK